MHCSTITSIGVAMSDLPSHSSSGHSSRRSSVSGSSRHSTSRRVTEPITSRSSRHESSSSRRRSHSITGGQRLPPSSSTDADLDEETRARLARREERRRRRREEEAGQTKSETIPVPRQPRRAASLPEPRRSSSVPRPPSPAPFGGTASKPKYFQKVEKSEEEEEKAFDEEAADAAQQTLSAKKAAYLRAVSKRENRTSRRISSTGGSHSPPPLKDEESPSKSSKHHRSSSSRAAATDGSSPSSGKRERKSSRRSSVATSAVADERKVSRRSSVATAVTDGGDGRSEKERKREKKEKKKSSRKDDDTKSHRSSRRHHSSRSDDEMKESHRSSRRHSSRSNDDESGRSKEKKRHKEERSHRSSRRSSTNDLMDHSPKERSRGKSTDRLVSTSSHQREEFRRRRDERVAKGEEDAEKEEEYRRRREERKAQREERRRLSGDLEKSGQSRTRSASMPRYSDLRSRTEGSSDAKPAASAETTTAEKKNIFGAVATGDISKDKNGGLFGSNDAEAARERLRERMAARQKAKAKDAALSDSESARSRGVGVGEDSLPSTRPKLVDVRRRGIASVLKQQRTGMEDAKGETESSSSSSESESEDESSVDHESDNEESSVDNEDGEAWTVRVSLISAVDLPLHVVPNMPLCPVLKFGLVDLPAEEGDTHADKSADGTATQSSADEQKSSIVSQIEKSGLLSLPKARVRCTSNKILSKRDNGSVEFHEELRWDRVKRPMQTALVVELAAKASSPPSNLRESPMLLKSKPTPEPPKPDPPTMVESATTNAANVSPALGTGSNGARPEIKRPGDSSEPSDGDKSTVGASVPSISRTGSSDGDDATPLVHGAGLTGMRALWKRGRQQFEQRQIARLNEAKDDPSKGADSVNGKNNEANGQPSFGQGFLSRQSTPDRSLPSIADENVALRRPKKRRKLHMTEDLRLGSLVIPLTRLPLEKAIQNKEVARVEQWYQLDAYNISVPSQSTPTWRGKGTTKPLPRRSPTVQLEISFSPPEVVDDSEDDMDDISLTELAALEADESEGVTELDPSGREAHRPSLTDGSSPGTARSFARRAAGKSLKRRVAADLKSENELAASQSSSAPVKKVPEDPLLEPGLVDYISVVGVSSIGDQKDDDGGRGWVNTTPECNLLERFPPDDEFHHKNGRNVGLADKVEWFCFPAGWKLWRGTEPPSPEDLGMTRYPGSTSAMQSNAAFDACLGCTTSFSWFVIASNSDEYGSKNVKTYGAVIKFYVPAPKGIDPTQDDYAQSGPTNRQIAKPRLWVPMGICLTSNLPIVGVMEAILLRICETLRSADALSGDQKILPIIHKDIANLIVNFQTPIPGVLHCSIPFLQGERLHVTLPPPTGLPPLPHGSSVTAVCRLLGAEGLNLLLAALLTECKIIIHSNEISNLPMVSEVAGALLYPFNWSLPCIPVLPDAMLEFVEAPLSYFLGIPTSSVKLIDPSMLEDVVVVDLDSDFGSSDYYDGR